MINKDKLCELVKESSSKSDVARGLGYNINGSGLRKVNNLIKEFGLDISHFDYGKSKTVKYCKIEKTCPVCGNTFNTKSGHRNEKTTCSYSCSNTYFRSGRDNGNWSDDRYRTTCFLYHKKECVICGENKIIDVHHFDEDKTNNSPHNLIPLCPTHHMYWHSRYKEDVYHEVIEYRDNFINNRVMD